MDSTRQNLGIFFRETGITHADLEVVVALHQEVHEINKTKRLFFNPSFVVETDGIVQATSCKGTFNTGFVPLTRRRTKTLFRKHDIEELQHGSLRAVYWQNGKRGDRFCGFMVNVCFSNRR